MKIEHGTSVGAYQRCLKRPQGSCDECKAYVAKYQREKAAKAGSWRPKKKEEEEKVPEIRRSVRYVFICDGCANEIISTVSNTTPPVGVVGEITFVPETKGYGFYSCKDDMTHISRAIRTVVATRAKKLEESSNAQEE